MDEKKMAYSLGEDVTPTSIYIEAENNATILLIEEGAFIPFKTEYCIEIGTDEQKSITIHLLQGFSKNANENRRLASLTVENTSSDLKAVKQVVLTFELDKNGILHFSSVNKEVKTFISKMYGGLTLNEIGEMKRQERIRQKS